MVLAVSAEGEVDAWQGSEDDMDRLRDQYKLGETMILPHRRVARGYWWHRGAGRRVGSFLFPKSEDLGTGREGKMQVLLHAALDAGGAHVL